MGKFDALKYLSKKEIDELFVDFAKALASIHNSVEAANFIKDLLTEPEVVILARRLQIARLLDKGFTYEQIHKAMKVGNSTIAKVHSWMNLYGEGFRTIIKRTKPHSEDKSDSYDPLSWSKHKKKYPMYYWPELVLKEIVNTINKKEKQRLLKVVSEMKEKTKVTKELMRLLQPTSISHSPVYGRIKG